MTRDARREPGHRRQLRRKWLGGAVACTAAAMALLSASLLLAKPGVVKTRDGRSIEGDIDERGDSVVVTVRGIPTSIPRENVDTVEYKGSIEDQYKERLAKLPKPAAAADHLDLARWLLSNRAYDLANQEVIAAQRIDPNSTDAATLQQTIEGQKRLDRTAKAGGTTPRPPGPGTPPRTDTGAPAAPSGSAQGYTQAMHKYITAEDVNTIRQMEWSQDDNSVRVTFNGDVKQRFVKRMQLNAAQFNSQPPVQQAKQIMTDGTADERKDVRVLTDPSVMSDFKRTIQPMVLTGCATAACHGGPAGGHFFLYNPPENDAATYTNFYLLTQAVTKTSNGELVMVDRSYPEKSLLALWGLPSEVSKNGHPPVPGVVWRPMFRSMDDGGYRALTNWITKLVPLPVTGRGSPVPQYGFSSPLPPLPGDVPPPPPAPTATQKASTRPGAATRPANRPPAARPR